MSLSSMDSPLESLGYGHALAGIVVLVVAAVIGLVAPLFQTALPVPR